MGSLIWGCGCYWMTGQINTKKPLLRVNYSAISSNCQSLSDFFPSCHKLFLKMVKLKKNCKDVPTCLARFSWQLLNKTITAFFSTTEMGGKGSCNSMTGFLETFSRQAVERWPNSPQYQHACFLNDAFLSSCAAIFLALVDILFNQDLNVRTQSKDEFSSTL